MNKTRKAAIILLVASAILTPAIRTSRAPAAPAPHSADRLHAGAPASETQRTTPTSIAALISFDAPDSLDPVERATAAGAIIDSRILATDHPRIWDRQRLVSTVAQPRPVLVRERWEIDPARLHATCLRREMFLADQLIVRTRPEATESDLRTSFAQLGMTLHERLAGDLFTVRLARADLDAISHATTQLAAQSLILSSEPDGVGFGGGNPNDPLFPSQWGSHNTGQSGGTADADMNAPELWDILENASGMVIAVLDSGLNFSHPDLQNVAWNNPGEIAGDGIDNDSSGKIDDVTGWDFVNGDNNPTDDHGHGSNVTGIMVATRNNSIGIAGLLSGARILTCKILNSSNSGTTSNLIAATTYARQRGAKLMNLSLQNYPYSSALDAEFTACLNAGVLLSICAGNQGVNNDSTPNYPSSYPHANIIAVGNHDRTDARWTSSNYGIVSVDLFAPGREILGPDLGTGYSSFTGTSQATPYVTAVCAAISAANPALTAGDIKNAVLGSVTLKNAYSSLCVTGGRLNAVTAMGRSFRHATASDNDGDQFTNLFEYLAGTRIDSATSAPSPPYTELTSGYFRIGMSRVPRTEGGFIVETSQDLISWTTSGLVDFSSAQNLLVALPINSGSPRGFLRITAVPPP